MWRRVTRHRCRRRQRLRGLHRGSAEVRPTLRRPGPRQPQTIDPVERGLTRPTGGTAQADSLIVAPLPRPTWAVAVGRSRSFEQPLPDTRRNLLVGRFGMGAKVFRSNHLHAEISQLEGHLDTGFIAVEHRNSLSRGSDMLGLRAERAADRASRTDLGEECDSTSNRQTPHRTHDHEGRRTCTHQRERVRPMSGAPTTPIKRQPTGRACRPVSRVLRRRYRSRCWRQRGDRYPAALGGPDSSCHCLEPAHHDKHRPPTVSRR